MTCWTLQEVAGRELRGLAIPAIVALRKIIENEKHPDHRRGVEMVLDRIGLHATTEHKIEVAHRDPNSTAVVARIRDALLKLDRLGYKPAELMMMRPPSPTIEGDGRK